jgi:methionyl-tRNA formyltransferase
MEGGFLRCPTLPGHRRICVERNSFPKGQILFVFAAGGCIITRTLTAPFFEAPTFALTSSQQGTLRVAFMGSDDFSVPSLRACLAQTDVVAVFTQPDRRSGRGRKRLMPSPVKEFATDVGLRVEQPERLDNEATDRLRSFEPDLTVVAAYGQILRRPALEVARVDTINVHASLLPRHRGAAPIAAAIRAGDPVAGVTVMKVRRPLDAGEIIAIGDPPEPAVRMTPIGERETTGELSQRLAVMGGDVLATVLRAFAAGSVTYQEQDHDAATVAPRLTKHDGRIDWDVFGVDGSNVRAHQSAAGASKKGANKDWGDRAEALARSFIF